MYHCVTSWAAAHQALLSSTISWSLLNFMPIELIMLSNHFFLCHTLFFLPSIFLSIRIFSSDWALLIRWPNTGHSASTSVPGLISFRMDWLDLLAVQGTLKNLLQHHSSKASFLECSAFFMAQLSHPCMSTEKTIVLTRWTFIGKNNCVHAQLGQIMDNKIQKLSLRKKKKKKKKKTAVRSGKVKNSCQYQGHLFQCPLDTSFYVNVSKAEWKTNPT